MEDLNVKFSENHIPDFFPIYDMKNLNSIFNSFHSNYI